MIRLMAAVRTALVLTAWLLGVPMMLAAVAGSPLPARPPSVTQIQAWTQDPLNPVYKQDSVRLLAWAIWALITILILTIVALQLRTVRWKKIISYLPPPAQSLAAAILGTAAVATSTAPLLTTPAAASPATSTAYDLDIAHPAPATCDSPGPASGAAEHARDGRTTTASPTSAHSHPTVLAAARTTSGGSGRIIDRAGGATTGIAATAHITEQPRPGLPSAASGARRSVHRVVKGDTLWDIAGHQLGDAHRWHDIYHLNRGRAQADGHRLTDPDNIDVGWVLTVPAAHTDTPPAGPASTTPPADPSAPAAHHPAPPAGASSTPAAASTSTAPTVDPTGSRGGVPAAPAPLPDRRATPSAAPGTTNPTPSGTTAPSADGDHGRRAAPAATIDGVELPGGWITLGLGSGLVTAVAVVWRRRRHRYRPTPITSPQLHEPDLLPPLAAMTRIRTRLRYTAPDLLKDHPAPAPTVREYQTAVVKPALPPTGPNGTDLAGAGALPHTTGLALTGNGALDAARGLLVATLTAGSNDDPDARGHAIIPAATLKTLLGESTAELSHSDRLHVTATVADAITLLEEQIIRRARLIADAHVPDAATWRDTDVYAEPLPQLLLIAEAPDPAGTSRLATAIGLGHRVNIGAALIGDWPSATTLSVAADGTTGNHDAPRLSVLDTATANDMLAMLRETYDDTDTAGRPQPPTPNTAVTPAADTPAPAATAPATTTFAGDGRLPVTVRVLGRPAVLNHDGQPSLGIRSKAIELLVYLAVNRHGADLSDIMEALFPDATLRRAAERLSTAVADLRKHIRQAATNPAHTDQTPHQRLEPVPNTGSRYHLDPGVVRVDWWSVLDHYAAAATGAPGDDERLSHLTAAIDAAGGALADDCEYDWIDTDREVVRRHRVTLHTDAAGLLTDTDPHRSWQLLEQACQIDPLSDDLARTAMRAAATLGDAEAIRHRLKTLRDTLDAHGLEVSDDTETLATDLLRRLHPPRPSEQRSTPTVTT